MASNGVRDGYRHEQVRKKEYRFRVPRAAFELQNEFFIDEIGCEAILFVRLAGGHRSTIKVRFRSLEDLDDAVERISAMEQCTIVHGDPWTRARVGGVS